MVFDPDWYGSEVGIFKFCSMVRINVDLGLKFAPKFGFDAALSWLDRGLGDGENLSPSLIFLDPD